MHILVFPWLAFGHLIPFLEASKGLAKRGHRVTFLSTPRNIQRLPKLPEHLAPNISMLPLTLPRVDGLPDDAEATMDVPPVKFQYLKKAVEDLQEPIAALLERIAPDWIIHDFHAYWFPRAAAKLGIPCAFFCLFSASTMAGLGPSSLLFFDRLIQQPPSTPFHTDGVFSQSQQAYGALGSSDLRGIGLMLQECDAVAIRSCWEYEASWLGIIKEIHHKPVLPVGMLPPLLEETSSTDDGEDSWLDKKAQGSTLYVALGSEVRLSREQLHELAYGIELSGLPFIWALRSPPDEPAVLPEGFAERTKPRGVVHLGWVPQKRILAHAAVGGFLTHGGLNSVTEALTFGKPLVVFPVTVDQSPNARAIQDKKIGVQVPRKERDGSLDRGDVARLLRLVMVDAEGEQYRANAREMMDIFGNRFLHDRYMDDLVRYLQEHRRRSGPSLSSIA
ncbi:hypothetical protein ACLOJK_032919 [Asimina triloba]